MRTRVVVIGAGLAGLTAAYELTQSGRVDVTVVEAADRIGGRILTVGHDGHALDLGGFMIFPWYRTVNRLADELGLRGGMKELLGRGYLPTRDGTMRRYDRTPLRTLAAPRLLARLAVPYVRGDLNLYTPSVERLRGITCAELIDEALGPDSETARMIDMWLTAFTYPGAADSDATLVMSLAAKLLLRGGFDRLNAISGGMSELTNELGRNIVETGGRIVTSSTVVNVAPGVVVTADGTIAADYVVHAAGVAHPTLERVVPHLPPAVDRRSTRHWALFATTDGPSTVADDPAWDAYACHGSSAEAPHLVSLYNYGHARREPAQHTIVAYMRLHPDDRHDYTQADIERFAADQLHEHLDGLDGLRFVAGHHWERCMPVNAAATIEAVRAAQGLGGHFFAGDYLGFPCMETAAASGVRAARFVLKAAGRR